MQDAGATLPRIILTESVRASATMKYADSEIKLGRGKNDLYILQLRILPILVFIEAKKGDNPHDLCVVFDKTCPLITKKKNAFSTLMATSKPSKESLNSKFIVDVVYEFKVGYQNS